MKTVRGYIFSRDFMGERVPQHVQNLMLRDYCQRNGLHFLLSVVEYAMPHCHLVMEQALDELPRIDGIAAYSLFQLPAERGQRLRVLERIVDTGKELHLAVEGFSLTRRDQIHRIEDIWQVARTLPHCLKSAELA